VHAVTPVCRVESITAIAADVASAKDLDQFARPLRVVRADHPTSFASTRVARELEAEMRTSLLGTIADFAMVADSSSERARLTLASA
jgi:hypothetical protein